MLLSVMWKKTVKKSRYLTVRVMIIHTLLGNIIIPFASHEDTIGWMGELYYGEFNFNRAHKEMMWLASCSSAFNCPSQWRPGPHIWVELTQASTQLHRNSPNFTCLLGFEPWTLCAITTNYTINNVDGN